MIEIETVNLTLRRLYVDDVTETYVGWLNDPEVNKFLETRHEQQSIQSCLQFVESSNNSANTHLFGVFLKSNGQHIGNAKIGFIDPRHQRGQLSLFIGEKQFWNKGFSTEIVRSLTNYAFNNLGLQRMEAGCYEENLGSLRVFLKAGYVVEGFMRNHVVRDGKRFGCFWMGVIASEYIK